MTDSGPARLNHRIAHEDGDGTVIATVAFDGDLDLPVVEEFRAAVSRERLGDAGAVIIDLSAVHFIDSSGIHALVSVWKELGDSGRRGAIVVAGDSNVERVLGLTGLLEELAPVPDHATAVASIAGER
jgi:anti-sigma B factor antagonist